MHSERNKRVSAIRGQRLSQRIRRNQNLFQEERSKVEMPRIPKQIDKPHIALRKSSGSGFYTDAVILFETAIWATHCFDQAKPALLIETAVKSRVPIYLLLAGKVCKRLQHRCD